MQIRKVLFKSLNVLIMLALLLGGVALNVSPVQAVVNTVVIDSPTSIATATVKSGDPLDVVFTVTATAGDEVNYEILLGDEVVGSGNLTSSTGGTDTVTKPITIPGLSDDAYDLTVLAGIEGQSPIEAMETGAVIVDNPTSVEIDSPTSAEPVYAQSGDDVEVVFNVVDLNGAGQYRILLGSETFGPYAASFDGSYGQSFSKLIEIPELADGAYDLQVQAKLNTQTLWISSLVKAGAVIVDNTPPATPKLTSPNGGELISNTGSFTITWDGTKISDDHLVDNPITLQYSANGGANWTVIKTVVGNPDPGTDLWTVPDIVTTQALVRIIVTDKAGNTSADQSDAPFTIYGVDTTPPTVDMVPLNEYIGGIVALKATASDPHSGISSVVFQYSAAEGGPWTTAGDGELKAGDYVFDFDTTPLTDGAIYYFRAVATNGAGSSTASTAVDAKIENTPPAMTLLKPAADNDWLKENYQFEVQASDAQSEISKLVISQLKDTGWSEVCSYTVVPSTPKEAGVYTLSCSADDDVLDEDATKIKAVVTNGAGLTAEVIRAIQVDVTDPTIPLGMLLTPDGGAVLKIGLEVAITWTTTGISDDNLGETPISLELRRDGTAPTVLAKDLPITPGSFTWTVAGVPAANYQVCVVVSDLAGNTAFDCNSSIIIWGTDATPPVVTLAPVESPNKGTITLSATAADPESGIQQVEFWVKLNKVGEDYASVGEDTTAPYAVDWDTTPEGGADLNGKYMIKAVATNGVGTESEDIFGPVLIDNTEPSMESLKPEPDPEIPLSGSVIFSATGVTDGEEGSGIASVDFEYGLEDEDEEWVFTAIGAGTYNAGTHDYDSPAWDTTAFEDDTIVKIRVIVSDNAGNEYEFPEGGEGQAYVINNGELEKSIPLHTGWNLISLPLVPGDPAIDAILADLVARESVLQVVAWPYDADLSKIVELRWNGVQLTDITDLEDGIGYWVQMSKPDVLTFSGFVLPKPPMAPPVYNVYAGWNLIGFKSTQTTMTAQTYLGPDVSASVRMMYGYDAATGYTQIILDDVANPLKPGSGYWLAVSTNGIIYPPAE